MKNVIIIAGLIFIGCTPDQAIEAFVNQSHHQPPQNWANCQDIQNYYKEQIEVLENNRTTANDSITTVRINQYQFLQYDCN